MIRHLLAASLLACPHLATAQSWHEDPNVSRLAWGNANVLVRSDTILGLQLWAGTSRVLERNTPRRDYVARFEPDSIYSWLPYAQKVLGVATRPTTPDSRLRTPALVASDGSRLVLARAQTGGKWASRADIIFIPRDTTSPWSISADKSATKDFLQTLQRRAGTSFLQPHAVRDAIEPNPADSASCPSAITTPQVHYPHTRRQAGQSGDVWLTFIVRPDSTVDPRSYTILVSDGVEFTAAAVHAVGSVRYRPAMRDGHLVSAVAFQRVAFLMAD